MPRERASGQESTNFTERQWATQWDESMPSLAHGIEQMLKDYGPFWAQIVRHNRARPGAKMAFWATVVSLWRGEDEVMWTRLENTSIPGVRAMDELVESLYHVHPERSPHPHPCPLCPLDTAWFS